MYYDLIPVEKQPNTFHIHRLGEHVGTLNGGNGPTMYRIFCDMRRLDERRADDFMHGVVAGLQYPTLAGTGARLRLLTDQSIEWPPRDTTPIAPRVTAPTLTQDAATVSASVSGTELATPATVAPPRPSPRQEQYRRDNGNRKSYRR